MIVNEIDFWAKLEDRTQINLSWDIIDWFENSTDATNIKMPSIGIQLL